MAANYSAMDVQNEERADESTISDRLDQTVHIDSISQVTTEKDIPKIDTQEISTATQSTNEEYSTPNAESLADLIEPEDVLITNNEPSNIITSNITESDDKNLVENFEPTYKQPTVPTDNGILEFMTPEVAIELYKKIHTDGPPELDWKFYGRRVPGQEEQDKVEDFNNDKNETVGSEQTINQTANTEFDFDEDFALESETSIINESLQLKKRFEPGSDKKTNLSDIMSDIMKESHIDNR